MFIHIPCFVCMFVRHYNTKFNLTLGLNMDEFVSSLQKAMEDLKGRRDDGRYKNKIHVPDLLSLNEELLSLLQ